MFLVLFFFSAPKKTVTYFCSLGHPHFKVAVLLSVGKGGVPHRVVILLETEDLKLDLPLLWDHRFFQELLSYFLCLCALWLQYGTALQTAVLMVRRSYHVLWNARHVTKF